MQRWRLDRRASPLGVLTIVSDETGRLRALDFDDCDARMQRLLGLHYGTVDLADAPSPLPLRDALDRYFAGETGALQTVPVATGGTPFQRTVWSALRALPPGRTCSYGQLAAAIGRPGAGRAVGLANGTNPIAIVVPCHRVIGADGTLTGYAGGLWRKRWLLSHEAPDQGLLAGPIRS